MQSTAVYICEELAEFHPRTKFPALGCKNSCEHRLKGWKIRVWNHDLDATYEYYTEPRHGPTICGLVRRTYCLGGARLRGLESQARTNHPCVRVHTNRVGGLSGQELWARKRIKGARERESKGKRNKKRPGSIYACSFGLVALGLLTVQKTGSAARLTVRAMIPGVVG